MLNVLGLLANLVGVVLLFIFGMPYRISSSSGYFLVTEGNKNERDIKIDKLYKALGFVGLFLIIIGTIFQILATICGK